MAALSGNRVAWRYVSDDGNTYRVAAQLAIVSQGQSGGSAADGTVPEKPSAIKLRRCTVSNSAGHSRTVVLMNATAPLATAGTLINLNYLGNSEAFSSNGGFIPEGGPRKNVTKQVA